MAFIDGIRDLFPHTVTVTPWAGQNLYGEASYGDPLTYQAKIEQGVDLQRAGIGDRSIVPKYRVFLAEPIQVDVRDRLTLDVAYGSRNDSGVFEAPVVSIVMVKPIYDELEHVCTIIYCG